MGTPKDPVKEVIQYWEKSGKKITERGRCEEKAEKIEIDHMEKKAMDCAMQHIKIFYNQALRGAQADYREPCISCPHAGACQYDWLSIMKPLIERSEIKIKM